MWKLMFLAPCVLLFAGCATSVSMQSLDTGSVSYAPGVQTPAPATLKSQKAQEVLDKVAASSYPVQWQTKSGDPVWLYVGNTIFYGSVPCRSYQFGGPNDSGGLACRIAGHWKTADKSVMRRDHGEPTQLSVGQTEAIQRYRRRVRQARRNN